MKLDVKDSFKKIDKKEIEKLEGLGYYSNALISILRPGSKEPSNFIFTFLNPELNEIIQIVVDDEKVNILPSAKAGEPTKQRLDLKGLKTTARKILEKAFDTSKKETNEAISQAILALENNEWKVTFVTKSFRVLIIHFDAHTGQLKNIQKDTLIK